MKQQIAALFLAGAFVGPAMASAITLDFSATRGGIADGAGQGTGFNARLPGTGASLATNDTNLALNTAQGRLNITSTFSDPNGQNNLGVGEFLGTSFSSLGYGGPLNQNFSLRATFRNSQAPAPVDQFGIFLGNSSTNLYRIGVLSFGAPEPFMVQTGNPFDSNLVLPARLSPAFTVSPGDDLTLEIGRTSGVYTVSFFNLTKGTRYQANPSLIFLNGQAGLVGGVFITKTNASAANFSASVDDFSASVPEPGSLVLAVVALAALGGTAGRRRMSHRR